MMELAWVMELGGLRATVMAEVMELAWVMELGHREQHQVRVQVWEQHWELERELDLDQERELDLDLETGPRICLQNRSISSS